MMRFYSLLVLPATFLATASAQPAFRNQIPEPQAMATAARFAAIQYQVRVILLFGLVVGGILTGT